jgi:hypothetical protein
MSSPVFSLSTGGRREACEFANEPPQTLDEFRGALHALLGPDDIALGRRIRKHEPARGIGAIGRNNVVGIDCIAPALRHFLDRADRDFLTAVELIGAATGIVRLEPDFGGEKPLAGLRTIGLVNNHALRKKPGERLRQGASVARRLHRPCEKPCIEQVQNRMFDAADILIDG